MFQLQLMLFFSFWETWPFYVIYSIISFFAFNIWEQTSEMQNAKYLSLKYLCQDKVIEVCELIKKIPKFFKIQYLLIFMQSWLMTSEK